MKKIIAVLLAALLACTTVSALAAGQVKSTASVNLRVGPGLGYDKVDAVKPGTTLDYLDETSTDERGVDWYKVSYEGQSLWISSRYSKLDAESQAAVDEPVDETATIEVSGWYLSDLADVAEALGASNYAEVAESEVPNQYSNDALTVSGGEIAESFNLRGAGYSLFGVVVGMDVEAAKQLLTDAGLVQYNDTLSFQHPADEHSMVNVDGFDSCVNLVADADGRVAEVDWSTYSG